MPSDHHPCELILDIGPSRQFFTHRHWKNLNQAETKEELNRCLLQLPDVTSDLVTTELLEEWGERFSKEIYAIFDKAVPAVESKEPIIKKTSANARNVYSRAVARKREWQRMPTPELRKQWEEAELAAVELQRIERENEWHNYISRVVHDTGSYARLCKWSKRRELAKETAHMSPLKETDDSVPITDPKEQCDLLTKKLLGSSPGTTRESCRLNIPFADNARFTVRLLEPNELRTKFKSMPTYRATVQGGIPNRFLKLFQEVFIPHIEKFCKCSIFHIGSLSLLCQYYRLLEFD